MEDVDLQAPVRREWKPPFGPFPPDIRAFPQRALQLHGPGSDGIHGERVAGTVTIINGRHDRVVPVANAEFLDQRLPNGRVVLIDAGHFVWEEAPTEYAAAVLESITGDQA